MLKKEFKKSSFSSQVRFCVICRKNKDIVQVAHSKDPKISLLLTVSVPVTYVSTHIVPIFAAWRALRMPFLLKSIGPK